MKLKALVMAGGKAARLKLNEEKPLLLFRGRHLIEHVIEALKNSKYVDKIFVATSANTKKTEQLMKDTGISTIETPGKGYVEDILFAIKRLNLGKTVIVSADLPLISSRDIDSVIEEYQKHKKPALTVVVPLSIFEKYGLTPTMVIDSFVPAGVNIIDGNNLNGEEVKFITEKAEFALNINTQEDLKLVEVRKCP